MVPEDQSSDRLDKVLARLETSLSRSRVKTLILSGSVSVDGEPCVDPSSKVHSGAELEIVLPETTTSELTPEDIPLDVAFEDEHVIVVNKPPGMVVHPAPGHTSGTLVNALLFQCGGSLTGIGGVSRPGIVHRLDKDTSGLMVAAKTEQAHERLVTQFADRSISRRYLALVAGVPAPTTGSIETKIGRSRHNRKKMAVLQTSGREAVTHYSTRAAFGVWCAEVSCRLETGRTHQIRVHMAHKGHPVIGDPVYGRATRRLSKAPANLKAAVNGFGRQALHATELSFTHPATEKTVSFKASPPDDYLDLRHMLESEAQA